MAISDNQQKNFAAGAGIENKTSEYYNLSGKNPAKESTENLLQQKKGSWRTIIFVVTLVLIGMWFWWNIVQLDSATKDVEVISRTK